MHLPLRQNALLSLVVAILSCARPVANRLPGHLPHPSDVPAVSAGSEESMFHWHGSIKDGAELEVRATNGAVAAVGAEDAEVDVTARKTGRAAALQDLDVRVEQTAGRLVFCVVSRRDPTVDCAGGHDQSFGDARVDFTVRVPGGARFVGKSVNGDVSAERIALPVVLSTVNGSVRAKDVAATKLATVNGSIVAMLRVADGGDVDLKTLNGDIDVDVPGFGSDFVSTAGGRRVHVLLGQGSGVLDAKTVNGHIRLRRSS
jgi:hypothetical protein